MDLRQFLQVLGEEHLFITTCIEKKCTWPLSFMLLTLVEKNANY